MEIRRCDLRRGFNCESGAGAPHSILIVAGERSERRARLVSVVLVWMELKVSVRRSNRVRRRKVCWIWDSK
jgi:hypothetical protein